MTGGLLLEVVASAAMRDVCVGIEPEYVDAVYSSARYDLEDYLNDNDAVYPVSGIQIEVVGVDTKIAGADGCARFSVNTSTLYTIRAYSKAEVEVGDPFVGYLTETVRVRDDDDTPAFVTISWTNWDPPETDIPTTRNITGGARVWNVLLAATFALGRTGYLGWLGEQTWDFYVEDECGTLETCFDPAQDAVYVDNDQKVRVVEALGLNMAQRALPYPDINQSVSAAKGDCHSLSDPAHELQQKEFATQAYWDGLGFYYVARTFNDLSETDCFIQYVLQEDWDLDNDNDPYTVNCAGVPWETAGGGLMDGGDGTNDPSIGDNDYYGDVTVDLACNPGGTDSDRATAYDFLRFLVALEHDDGWDWNRHLFVLGYLDDPDSWGSTHDVFYHLHTAIDTVDYFNFGWADEWLDLGDHHGVDR